VNNSIWNRIVRLYLEKFTTLTAMLTYIPM